MAAPGGDSTNRRAAGGAGVPPAGSRVPPEPIERTTGSPFASTAATDVRRGLRGTRSTAGGTPAQNTREIPEEDWPITMPGVSETDTPSSRMSSQKISL